MLLQERSPALSVEATRANLGITIAFPLLACLAVGLRFYCKKLKSVRAALDDWLILAALIVHLGQAAVDIDRAIAGKFGHPQSELTHAEFETYIKLSVAGNVLYPTVITLARCSICWFGMRIFAFPAYRVAGFALIGLDVIWFVFAVGFYLGRCTPVSQQWHPQPGGHCVNVVYAIISVASLDMVCDLVTFILPLPALWRLQMSKVPKIGVTAVFALGLIIVALGAARVATGVHTTRVDFTSTNTIHADLYFVESSLLIVVACMPLMKPLLDAIFPSSARDYIRSWGSRGLESLHMGRSASKSAQPSRRGRDAGGSGHLLGPMPGQAPASARHSVTLDPWVMRGGGQPAKTATEVHAAPLATPRWHGLRGEQREREDEIRVKQEVEVSFV